MPHATEASLEDPSTSYLRSILSVLWCDLCLFMDYYFGH